MSDVPAVNYFTDAGAYASGEFNENALIEARRLRISISFDGRLKESLKNGD